MTITLSTHLTQTQTEFLRQWGRDRGITKDSDLLRAVLREHFKDSLPPDPAQHGGYRGKHTPKPK